MNLNQEQLIIFKKVMETGSFSAAARALGKVPSAVSMSIANLEIDLNLQLFERIGREPVPTSHAKILYEKAEQLLIEMNQWKQLARSLSTGLESELNIVVVSELLHTRWTDYIAALEAQFPTLQINIFTAPQEDAQKMLINGTAQFALMFEREQLESNEQFIELKQQALIPVAAKNYALAQFTQQSFEQILQSRQIVVASRDRNIRPELLFSKNYWRTDNHHSACAMILQNLGWGVLPVEMLDENPFLKKQLKVLNFSDFTPKFDYFVDLVWNRESLQGTAARFLIDYVKKLRKNTV
ncbi:MULTISPECIES: HTH-type transcriptional regulator AceR [Acinetobacter]|uniref:HTH-type transcriptional regulator AceR n=1 Tax=Acinetobacter TaxID=469 RepID=UPI000E3515AE|nr:MULTISPECIES: LysR family transcriptional regulator [Acinetobacter]RFS29834.1 LysR family transcriptional regulator [Acinetobacter sp. SWAC5]RKG46671.1 LysR family transcriptional regulator [Acinetobacter cumulans]RZG62065.1 LysR family transcriptional regulator [Acinetobacter sp. WCHAc060006]